MHDLAYTALMAGKFGSIDTCSESQYKAQRHYMVRIARSVPIFMLLGDHDGERGDRADMAEWSPGMRCHTAKGESEAVKLVKNQHDLLLPHLDRRRIIASAPFRESRAKREKCVFTADSPSGRVSSVQPHSPPLHAATLHGRRR